MGEWAFWSLRGRPNLDQLSTPSTTRAKPLDHSPTALLRDLEPGSRAPRFCPSFDLSPRIHSTRIRSSSTICLTIPPSDYNRISMPSRPLICPVRGDSEGLRPSRFRLLDLPLRIVGLRPWRCQDCQRRFHGYRKPLRRHGKSLI
jgi:hypothetical protein